MTTSRFEPQYNNADSISSDFIGHINLTPKVTSVCIVARKVNSAHPITFLN